MPAKVLAFVASKPVAGTKLGVGCLRNAAVVASFVPKGDKAVPKLVCMALDVVLLTAVGVVIVAGRSVCEWDRSLVPRRAAAKNRTATVRNKGAGAR